jgi:hypothetical protein
LQKVEEGTLTDYASVFVFMNEKELKGLFWTALKSGHVKNNTIIPGPNSAELRVVQEANFRSFDLLLATVTPHTSACKPATSAEVLARSKLMTHFAKRERCRADHLHFYPIELKSDEDVIDERLPNQVIDAILTFGLSILVLDINHSRKIKDSKLDRMLPATIIGYTGVEDYFEVISVFDRFISCGIFEFERINLARLLQKYGRSQSARSHRRLELLQQILQKIIFSQLHFENPGLSKEEELFISALADITVPSRKKMFAEIIKESANTKLTDYT